MSSVSIVVATRGRHRQLGRLLASLHGEPPAQLVVVEDGEPYLGDSFGEGVPPWLRLERLRLPRSLGIAGARNAGLAVASGEVVAFLDDDAVCETGWFAAARSVALRDDFVAYCGAVAPFPTASVVSLLRDRTYYFEVFGPAYFERPPIESYAPAPYASGGNSAYRAAVFREVGTFRADLPAHVDVEFGQRVRARYGEGAIRLNRHMRIQHEHPTSGRAYVERAYRAGVAKARYLPRAALWREAARATRLLLAENLRHRLPRVVAEERGIARLTRATLAFGVLSASEVAHLVGIAHAVAEGRR